MCGLTGYWSFGNKETSNAAIRKMLEIQRHRGPDDQGIDVIDTLEGRQAEVRTQEDMELEFPADLVLGFNRLSILDLSYNGHQPMKAGAATLMLNGEIYNAFDIKPELEAKGYKFKSTTDTEVVLHAYREWGIGGMLKRLNGMFAIVIYDAELKQLFLARDRFGVKPLYVYNSPERIAFSSEMKSLHALPGFRFELDSSNMGEFLVFRNLINRTLFRNVVNLEPGTYWTIGRGKDITKTSYYRIEEDGQLNLGQNGYSADALSDKLEQAVKRQMISDVKLGCQLSGGVDSSLVTYYAKGILEKGNLETISIIPEQPGFSEESYMDEVIDQLGINAHKYPLDATYYLENLDRVSWQFEQPLNHPNTVGIYQISEAARKHVTVLLSGEGADELLGGYPRFIQERLPFYKSRSMLSRLKNNFGLSVAEYSRLLGGDMRIILGSMHTSLIAVKRIFPDFDLDQATAFRKELWEGFTGDDFLRQRKYEMVTYLPDLLMRQDKMSMAHSIENRVPFLDNDFVSHGMSLGEKPLLYAGQNTPATKRLLKEVATDKFSREFAYRNKQGFAIPLRSFMQSGQYKSLWNDVVMPGINDSVDFDKKELQKVYANVVSASPFELEMIWMATSFALFQKHYLN